MADSVNHPDHYNQGKIEVVDFTDDQDLSHHLASAVEYICRAKHKGSYIEDLEKAVWRLVREINLCHERREDGRTLSVVSSERTGPGL